MEKFAVLVAGGVGSRLDKNIPKQFLSLNGIPILMRTIKQFYDLDKSIILIVVLPKNHIDTWKLLCKEFSFEINHIITIGGETRFQSVKNGLSFVKKDSMVAIHDAARPLVSTELISKCYSECEKYGSAIPLIDIKESAREIKGATSKSILREKFKLVQTPQCFFSNQIKYAYNKASHDKFTDDATVYEDSGKLIHIIDGEESNIKITTPFDMLVAEAFIS